MQTNVNSTVRALYNMVLHYVNAALINVVENCERNFCQCAYWVKKT